MCASAVSAPVALIRDCPASARTSREFRIADVQVGLQRLVVLRFPIVQADSCRRTAPAAVRGSRTAFFTRGTRGRSVHRGCQARESTTAYGEVRNSYLGRDAWSTEAAGYRGIDGGGSASGKSNWNRGDRPEVGEIVRDQPDLNLLVERAAEIGGSVRQREMRMVQIDVPGAARCNRFPGGRKPECRASLAR